MAKQSTLEPEQPEDRDGRKDSGEGGRRRERKPLTDSEKAAAAVGGIVSTIPPV